MSNNNTISHELKSLENVNFINPKEKINSPRSIEAIKLLGIEFSSLYFIPFETYISQHKELKSFTKELQERRYNHFESKRKIKIELAKEKRKELIEKKSRMIKSNSTQYLKNINSTMINQEKERLILLKNQQISELKNRIEFEFKVEELRKKNDEKIKLQLKKEE